MKRIGPIILTVVTGLYSQSHGEDAWFAPDPPVITRTLVELIEVPREMVDGWFLDDSTPIPDSVIREKTNTLVDSGAAKVLDQLCLTSRNGMLQSGPFLQKPSGFMPAFAPENLADFAKYAPSERGITDFVSGPSPKSWYDERLGVTLQVRTGDRDASGAISGRITAEITCLAGRTIHQEWKDSRGRADIATNITSIMRFDGSLRLKHGRQVLAAYGPPCDANGVPDPTRVVMMFVRADQLVSPLAPEERVPQEGETDDPFAPGTKPVPSGAIRTTVELIKVPFKRHRELLAPVRSGVEDDDLHQQVDAWLENGEAELLDIRMHTSTERWDTHSHAGTRTKDPANHDFGTVLGRLDERSARLPDVVTPPFPSGWESSWDGFTLTTCDMSSETPNRISGSIRLHCRETTGETIWREWRDNHGDQSIRSTDAQTHEVGADILSHPGKWVLVASLNPPDQRPGQAPSHKILLFAKSQAIPLKTP